MSLEQQPEYDISVIVTAHAEGRLAHRTMRSVQAAISQAEFQGLRCEIIVVLDNPTAETLAYFECWRALVRVMEVSTKDLGINRNLAVKEAKGKYVACIDADDLMGRSWLQLAYECAERSSLRHFIVHAEYTVYFGNRHNITRHLASNDPEFPRVQLARALSHNPIFATTYCASDTTKILCLHNR